MEVNWEVVLYLHIFSASVLDESAYSVTQFGPFITEKIVLENSLHNGLS